MPLAKSAPVATPVTIQAPENTTPLGNSVNGLPEQFLYSLGIDYNAMRDLTEIDQKRLGEIYKWADSKSSEKTLGNVLKHIKDLEIHLGSPSRGETRLSKMWRYVHISNQINDLELSRNQLERRY